MNKEQLRGKLKNQNINPNLYSLDGDLITDRIILMTVGKEWEVFYFDDKGKKDNVNHFHNENDACNYIYQILENIQQIANRFGLNN
jgi:hypothetical protein